MFQALGGAISSTKLYPNHNLPLLSFFSKRLLRSLTTKPISVPNLRTLVLSRFIRDKFTNVLQNVVALPSVLLAASQSLNQQHNGSLYDSVSRRFSIEQMGQDISVRRFNPESHCVFLRGSKGESLVVPNLQLKVFIEAIRMVLEVVFERGFLTFSYGGRIGMGRHTAIRYLKNSVENPTWWFTVCFDRVKFEEVNVEKLCSFIQEKIDDDDLVDVIKKLFKCGVLEIELGSFRLGRGLPQECGLSSILINIYFHGLDKELQERRFMIKKEQPRLAFRNMGEGDACYKPVRMYAVRYLDEILVVSSGSKKLIRVLNKMVQRYLEEKLHLTVDKGRTVIHSAVWEKVSFLGMELTAVPPSVLRPPKSEKAIRARKKFLRQKEVRIQERQNSFDRRRRKLGRKIFSHVFKKSKRMNGIKFDFQIENEVRQIFAMWADEVFQGLMASIAERSAWHRLLTDSDFFYLRHIRELLPLELVDAYDSFQQQVHKHLSPLNAMKAAAEKEIKAIEEHEQKYADRTLQDLTQLCMRISAPMEVIQKAVKIIGFTNRMGRPRPISLLISLEDSEIVKWYAGIGKRWLDFYCCCHNFKLIKTIVTYHLRFSCILTLAEKHEATKREAIRNYSKVLKVFDNDGKEKLYFPTESEVRKMLDRELSDPKPVDGTLSLALIRMAIDPSSRSCAAHFCGRDDIVLYRVNLLNEILIANSKCGEDWLRGMGTIHSSLHRKCLPLCRDHADELYLGRMTLQNIDFASLVELD